MRFRMFPKLADRLSLDAPEGPYIALEKIHGAQLVIGLDAAGALSIGKRKAWLDGEEPFFGWQLIRAELGRAARELRELLEEMRAARRGPWQERGPLVAAPPRPGFDLVMLRVPTTTSVQVRAHAGGDQAPGVSVLVVQPGTAVPAVVTAA